MIPSVYDSILPVLVDARPRRLGWLAMVSALVLLFGGPAMAQDATDGGDAIVGEWLTEAGVNQARIRIERHGDRYRGVIIALNEPNFPASEGPEWEGKPKVDRMNPDAALHSRPIIGLQLLDGFRYRGKQRWDGGTIYDPESGKTYKCKMTLRDAATLDVRGFIGLALIGRTTVWTRAPTREATE